ncbi:MULTISPECIES: Tn3 family transposase [Burkholderia]|nr:MULTISPECIES: Tn3 family transposase [Burkholderia]MDI9677083.1 Tn3 family transposase [Burkholderia cenocepacia]MDI9687156.1 Tn3 family transposase [Burkholderia cenocepacia]MDN7658265.1 Tn3 family transposase [Burkholderia cenocepacia]MDN7822449.1 Tn3 family transposase [Burkholderia cenocepacia]MDO5917642.1 Tn3 family transposase [Burkholderia cenocepacia]
MRDAKYVLEGMSYQESDLLIAEHYADTTGFIDHVFGLFLCQGFVSPLW